MIRRDYFLLHLFFSACVTILGLNLLLSLWFPDGLAQSSGMGGILVIIILIDVVLGPLLTLIIANPKKSARMLRWNLFTIALIQLAGLAYGVQNLASLRPINLVLFENRLEITYARERMERPFTQNQDKAFPITWAGPELLVFNMPEDKALAWDILNAGGKGFGVGAFTDHLLTWSQGLVQVKKAAVPASKIMEADPEWQRALIKYCATFSQQIENIGVISLRGREGRGALLVNLESGQPLRLIDMTVPREFRPL